MRRVLNWDTRATAWAVTQIGRPFAWGETDCASLVRAMVRVMYDEDMWPDLTYTSLRGAMEELASGGSILDRLLSHGAEAMPGPLYAHTGDVLLGPPFPIGEEDDPFDICLPVITDQFLLTGPGQVVAALPLTQAPVETVAYRLPHG